MIQIIITRRIFLVNNNNNNNDNDNNNNNNNDNKTNNINNDNIDTDNNIIDNIGYSNNDDNKLLPSTSIVIVTIVGVDFLKKKISCLFYFSYTTARFRWKKYKF